MSHIENLMEYPIQTFLVMLPSAAPPGPLDQSNPWISSCGSFSHATEDLLSVIRSFRARCVKARYEDLSLCVRLEMADGLTYPWEYLLRDHDQYAKVLDLIRCLKTRPAQPSVLF